MKPSVTTPGNTNLSDATDQSDIDAIIVLATALHPTLFIQRRHFRASCI